METRTSVIQPTADGLSRVIDIDGGNQVGKTTVMGILVQMLGYRVLQSGLLYRIITWLCVRDGVPCGNEEAVVGLVMKYLPDIRLIDGFVWFGDRKMPEADLRTKQINDLVPTVSKYPLLRKAIMPLQRQQAIGVPGLIAEGRDMGSVVFPESPAKFFLTARLDVRILRESRKPENAGWNLKEIEADILERDRKDSERHCSPMVKALDAIEIDTSELTPTQVAHMIYAHCVAIGMVRAPEVAV